MSNTISFLNYQVASDEPMISPSLDPEVAKINEIKDQQDLYQIGRYVVYRSSKKVFSVWDSYNNEVTEPSIHSLEEAIDTAAEYNRHEFLEQVALAMELASKEAALVHNNPSTYQQEQTEKVIKAYEESLNASLNLVCLSENTTKN